MTVSPVPFRVHPCASSVPSRETSAAAAVHIATQDPVAQAIAAIVFGQRVTIPGRGSPAPVHSFVVRGPLPIRSGFFRP